MDTTGSRSRMLSLRAPIATEAERSLFQRRLALCAFVVFVLASGFLLIADIAVAVVSPDLLTTVVSDYSSKVHYGTTALALLIWIVARRGKPTRATLDVLDALMSFGLCLGWALMIARQGFAPAAATSGHARTRARGGPSRRHRRRAAGGAARTSPSRARSASASSTTPWRSRSTIAALLEGY